MIRSKKRAVVIQQRFRFISKLIGESLPDCAEVSESERRALADVIAKLLAQIVMGVDYPIITEHPELRPVDLLGSFRDHARYCIKCSDTIQDEQEETLIKDILPADADALLKKYILLNEKSHVLYWLELMNREAKGSRL